MSEVEAIEAREVAERRIRYALNWDDIVIDVLGNVGVSILKKIFLWTGLVEP